MHCHWLKITAKPVPIQSQALFHVICVVGLNGWYELFLYYISRSCSAALNKKNILSRFHFYFFSKTRKSFVDGTINLKIKKVWSKLYVGHRDLIINYLGAH